MDETLKARLIGAAVLVAIAVLLIPELLSGRKAPGPAEETGSGPKGTRTFTIELEGMPGQGAREPAAGSPGPAVKPQPEAPRVGREEAPPTVRAPATSEPQESAVARPPAPAPSAVAATAPVTKPAATPSPPPAASSRAGWYVQVGAFGSADSARKLVKELEAAGYPALASPVTRSGKTLHRVRVGPEAQRADADRLAGRLKARGLPATVVAND